MAELNAMMGWTFVQEIDVPESVKDLLVDGEVAKVAYKTVRDTAVVTNKRIIISDKQGMTGKKVEVYTIPFKSINMYSTENGGTFDMNSEIELWTKAGKFKLNLNKKVDIRKLDKIIAEAIL
ncbi:PH domain-containing protein [Planococcus sp. ISL-109]|uniref:PH domain-containing protein n=1 Tax=Planococcus sp. ISL-109 TaxID=2819166 RepID=UPI001BE6D830|nr:PH domain-containing protein [Planococcus sp. ISL-109]MBT2583807.1 PH domain-containing protein [Planococcus sp. ISL-109]